MRVRSAFHDVRAVGFSRSPSQYSFSAFAQISSLDRSNLKA
jgi:hypothetical protein